jgi:hypothetical protein
MMEADAGERPAIAAERMHVAVTDRAEIAEFDT